MNPDELKEKNNVEKWAGMPCNTTRVTSLYEKWKKVIEKIRINIETRL